jgi:translation elongation factor EF-Tu-like GTPase
MTTSKARQPDIEAEVTFLSTEKGGRSKAAFSGYRPNHAVKDDYLTSGEHTYLDCNEVLPGCTARALIKFITPEAYPHSLWVGRIITVQEGGRIVGHAKITKVLNPLLERDGP